jgi:dUTP pyrophosphatase
MSDGAACFDFYSIDGGVLHSGTTREQSFRTGIAIEVPDGYVLKVYSRSGHGFRHGVRLVNAVGICDADFRGEIIIRLRMDSKYGMLEIKPGDRIAQGMIVPVPKVYFNEVEELSETERGDKGYGSTGR